MTDAERGQIAAAAAEVYERFFVPALFGQWPKKLLEAAHVSAGDRVLDVGCGTGILARGALPLVEEAGRVVGLDPNPAMLSVARRSTDRVEWIEGAVERLPFEDASFDRVVSQFALMFVADREAGISEMARVLRPAGRIAIATWARLEETPGYAAVVDLLGRLFGEESAGAMRAPFVLGDDEEMRRLLGAHFDDVTVVTEPGVAHFDSIEAWVHTDIRGWTLTDMIDDDGFELLRREARRELARFETAEGAVEFAAPALFSTGVAPYVTPHEASRSPRRVP